MKNIGLKGTKTHVYEYLVGSR